MSLYPDPDDSDAEMPDWRNVRPPGDHAPATAIDADPIEPGALFHYINPKNPQKARRRFGKLYWFGWRRLVMSVMLLAFGVTFCIIGACCMMKCDETSRGVAFLVIGLIMFLPGMYGSLTLLFYVQCRKGYSYKDLPDMSQ